MRSIKKLVEWIDEELDSAKCYAEKYIELKAAGDSWAGKFQEMANQELSHSAQIHRYTVEQIENLKRVYKPPTKMVEQWEKDHVSYVEKHAWIKEMLQM